MCRVQDVGCRVYVAVNPMPAQADAQRGCPHLRDGAAAAGPAAALHAPPLGALLAQQDGRAGGRLHREPRLPGCGATTI